jgi:hypothetical protein
VHVGQARQQGGIAQVDDLRIGWCVRTERHFGDPVVDDSNQGIASEFAFDWVDQFCRCQVNGFCLCSQREGAEAKCSENKNSGG